MKAPTETLDNPYIGLMSKLTTALNLIDKEAKPFGLWWYARHVAGQGSLPKSYRNEEKWSGRLKTILIPEIGKIECERRYPEPSRRRCDIVCENWPQLGRLWLEVKGAWRHSDSKGTVKNPVYKKHLSAAGDDIDKILTLKKSVADHVGLLLLGFDTVREPMREADVEIVRSRARGNEWVEQYERWDDAYRVGGQVHAWLWISALK